MQYLIGILLVVTALTGAFGAWQYNRANDLQVSLTQSEANRIADLKKAKEVQEINLKRIAKLKEDFMRSQNDLRYASDNYDMITVANDHLRKQINKWRGRLDDETFKRPKVVARAARIAIRRSMRRAECITNPNCRPDARGEPILDTPSSSNGSSTRDPGSDRPKSEDSESNGSESGGRGRTEVRTTVLPNSGPPNISDLGRRTLSIIEQIPGFGGNL